MELDGLRAAAAPADDDADDDENDADDDDGDDGDDEKVDARENIWEASPRRSCKVLRCSSRSNLWSATSKTGDSSALEATTSTTNLMRM